MAVRIARKYRTLFLGLAALAAMIYGLVVLLEIPWPDVYHLLAASVIIVLATAIAGFIFAALIHWLRKKTGG